MCESLRALLAGAVDYTALFPPARLPLEQVVRNYAHYRGKEDRWMLGRLVVPADRLDELDAFSDILFKSPAKVRLCVAVGGGESSVDFSNALALDLAQISRFSSRYASRAQIDILEMKLPPHVQADWIAEQTSLRLDPSILCFVEPNDGQVSAVVEAYRLKTFWGMKIRCGGGDAGVVPGTHDLAGWIAAARDASGTSGGMPLKFAGRLYHAIRQSNASIPVAVHGFINVLAAAMFAFACRLRVEAIQQILREEQASEFRFDDDAMRYNDWMLPTAQIEKLRKLVTSFGCGSFDEPAQDLRSLGWM